MLAIAHSPSSPTHSLALYVPGHFTSEPPWRAGPVRQRWCRCPSTAHEKGEGESPLTLHSQYRAHRGACRKTPVVPHYRRPRERMGCYVLDFQDIDQTQV